MAWPPAASVRGERTGLGRAAQDQHAAHHPAARPATLPCRSTTSTSSASAWPAASTATSLAWAATRSASGKPAAVRQCQHLAGRVGSRHRLSQRRRRAMPGGQASEGELVQRGARGVQVQMPLRQLGELGEAAREGDTRRPGGGAGISASRRRNRPSPAAPCPAARRVPAPSARRSSRWPRRDGRGRRPAPRRCRDGSSGSRRHS